jgi:hypothetical protein
MSSTEAQAIAALFNGEADPVDGSLEFIEVAEDFGLPADEHHDLVDRLRDMGISVGDDVIPSIRSVTEVGEDHGQQRESH